MEHFTLVSKRTLSLTFKSNVDNKEYTLAKSWIKHHSDKNVERIVSFDLDDEGNIEFNTLDKVITDCKGVI